MDTGIARRITKMTLAEIIEEIYEGLGEPSDLKYTDENDDIDVTSTGWLKLVRAVNMGCMYMATFKFPTGRQLKLRLNEDTGTLFPTSIVNGLPVSSLTPPGTDRQLTLITAPIVNQLLIGRSSAATGVVRFVNGLTATLSQMTGTFINGEIVDAYSREFQFPDTMLSKKIIDVLQVVDSTGSVLTETDQDTNLTVAASSELGIPTSWRKIRQGIRFDIYPQDDLEYFIRYARGPIDLVNPTDIPELPVQMHSGLVLYGQWWGLRRAQESTDAYSVKRDLVDFMSTVRVEDDFALSGQIKIYPTGY
jgi:hypothetical protein